MYILLYCTLPNVILRGTVNIRTFATINLTYTIIFYPLFLYSLNPYFFLSLFLLSPHVSLSHTVFSIYLNAAPSDRDVLDKTRQ